ncbi:MAG TPA: type IV pilin protein [Burkholderiales bacterium]|nr:type IV pilin protein [Burkholderiales bacterium]
MRPQRGFTLIEAMITVAVIAILSMIAMPAYTDYVLRGKISEAVQGLADARVKQEQFFLDNRTYGPAATTCGAPLPQNTKHWDFSCSNVSTTTYTVTATGKASGGTAGMSYSIDEENVRSSVINASVGPKGWTGQANCWVVRKGGVC